MPDSQQSRRQLVGPAGQQKVVGRLVERRAKDPERRCKTCRDFERKDTREEASRAVAGLKAKGVKVNELSDAEAARMRAS